MPRKSTRNAQGNGTIRQRPDGRWEGRYTTGTDPKTGKQVQKSIYGKTQKDVREKLRQITSEIDTGTYMDSSKMLLSDWLDVWTAEYIGNVKAHTRKSYAGIIKNHIKPSLGKVKLSELTPVKVQKFINGLESTKQIGVKSDKKDNEDAKQLNPKSVKNIHGVLHSALTQAVQIGYIRNNPANLTVLPKRTKPEISVLEDDQVGVFLKTISKHRFENLYIVDLLTGMRQSELLGLGWQDIDFDNNVLYVRRQLIYLGSAHGGYQFAPPKNNKTRMITLPPMVTAALKRQHSRQYEWKLAAGEVWCNEDDLVFTDEIGNHIKHDVVYRNLKRVFKTMGVPSLRFHDLRHSFAVLSIASGSDIKTVQENLGHHTAAFTLDTYGHVTERMRRESADKLEKFVSGVSNL